MKYLSMLYLSVLTGITSLQAQLKVNLVSSIIVQREYRNIGSGLFNKFILDMERAETLAGDTLVMKTTQYYPEVYSNPGGWKKFVYYFTITAERIAPNVGIFQVVSASWVLIDNGTYNDVIASGWWSEETVAQMQINYSTPGQGRKVFVLGGRKYDIRATHFWHIDVGERTLRARIRSIVYNNFRAATLEYTQEFSGDDPQWRPPRPPNAWTLPANFGRITFWTTSAPEFDINYLTQNPKIAVRREDEYEK